MSPRARFLFPLALLVAASAPAAAQSPTTSSNGVPAEAARVPSAAPALTGSWAGTLRAGPIAARLRLTFAPGASGSMGAARITPDGPQPELGGEIRDLVAGEREVAFSVATAQGTMRFTGAPDGAGGLKGRLVVVGDGGAVEARGVWTASAERDAAPGGAGR
jgi:hypothetical protein